MKSKIDNEPHAQRGEIIKKAIFVEKSKGVTRGHHLENTKDSGPFPLGWLKNGNPPGDPRTAPRCSARSKRTGEPCRQPAMSNSKCRLHGGKATGLRTPQGLARSRKSNWRHGEYSQDVKAELKALRQGLKIFLNPGRIFFMTPAELDAQHEALDRLMNKLQAED
jgi:hypothetical protein